MKAVREVEAQGNDDHDDQQDVVHLSVLDQNRLEDVRRVLAGVDGFLELLVDVLPADDADRIRARREQLGHAARFKPVAFVLEIAHGIQLAARILESFEELHGFVDFCGAAEDHLRLFLRLGRIASTA